MFLVRNTQAESRCVKVDLFFFEMDKLRKMEWNRICPGKKLITNELLGEFNYMVES